MLVQMFWGMQCAMLQIQLLQDHRYSLDVPYVDVDNAVSYFLTLNVPTVTKPLRFYAARCPQNCLLLACSMEAGWTCVKGIPQKLRNGGVLAFLGGRFAYQLRLMGWVSVWGQKIESKGRKQACEHGDAGADVLCATPGSCAQVNATDYLCRMHSPSWMSSNLQHSSS